MWSDEGMAAVETESVRREEVAKLKASVPRPDGEPSPTPVAMLGVAFDRLTIANALKRVGEMVESRRPHYVVTANVDFLVQSLSDVELHRILLEAHLVLCDGTPLVWASRWLGNPLPERVAGADLTPHLLEMAAHRGYGVFFLGGSPRANEEAAARLRIQHPTLRIAGHYSPPFRSLLEMDHAEIARQIRAAAPELLFVSLGCPKQEKWIAMHYRSLGVPVVIGVGAVVDFLAGSVKRAPLWMQRSGTEWIFRLLQEPRRLFRRYALDVCLFGPVLASQWWCLRSRGRRSAETPRRPTVMTEPTWQRVRAPERLDAASILRDAAVWDLLGGRHCLLDLSDVVFVDSTGVGLLIRLAKKLHADRRELVLVAPSEAVLGALKLMQLRDFFSVAADAIEARCLIAEHLAEPTPPVLCPLRGPLRLHGEITAANAEDVWSSLKPALEEACASRNRVDLDVSEIRFIDSSGLGVLVRARKLARHHSASLHFAGLQPAVRNVLRLAQLEAFVLEDKT
jgi:N-acetylglucosaminyldiphosphoundecaprenol N-acetyl-beta-D-mannosaminyltransferase